MPLKRTVGLTPVTLAETIGSGKSDTQFPDIQPDVQRAVGGGPYPTDAPSGSGRSDTVDVPDDHIRGRLTAPNLARATQRNYVRDSSSPDINPNLIIVAPSGGDFTSIALAIASITNASAVNPYGIQVEPGIYPEPSMTVPSYVSIEGTPSVYVVATDPNNPLFGMSNYSVINQIGGIIGPANDACVLAQGGLFNTQVENISFISGLYGIRSTDGSRIIVEECKSFPGCLTMLRTDGGGRIDSSNCLSFSPMLAHSDGAGSETWIHNSGGEFNTNGLYATDGGVIRPFLVTFFSCSNVVRVDTGGMVKGSGVHSQGISVWDVLQESASSIVSIGSGTMDSSKFSVSDWSNVFVYHLDTQPNEEGLAVSDRLKVGVPELGRETSLGEGPSYIRGMLVYTFDGANYADVSDAARSPSGSTFTFPNNNVNSAIYVASSLLDSDFLKHFGIRSTVVTACVPGIGKIVSEYWDGASWTEFSTMSSDSEPPYYPYADAIFERVQTDHIRYRNSIQADWTKNDDPGLGTDYFWVRFRIDTAITTAPVFERWKLHSSRTRFGPDGWTEYFGNARPVSAIFWDVNMFQGFQNSPGNQDLYVLNLANVWEDIGVGRIENDFVNGVIDQQGICVYIPFDMDTSCPLRLRFTFISTSGAPGDVEWFVNAGFTSDGDTVSDAVGGAPATIKGEQHISSVVTVAANDAQQTAEFEIDVSEMVSRRMGAYGDILWISIARDATAGNPDDTLGGDVAIIQVRPVYTKWCEGGHYP